MTDPWPAHARLAAVAAWGARVDHVHLKDVRLAVARDARRDGPVPLRDWWSDANTALGRGDVDLEAVLAALHRSGYDGWLVVEQDVAPHGGPQLAEFARDQRDNHETLTALLAARRPGGAARGGA